MKKIIFAVCCIFSIGVLGKGISNNRDNHNGIRFAISSGGGAAIAMQKYKLTGVVPLISQIAITHNIISFGIEHKFNPYKPTYLTYKYGDEVAAKTKITDHYIGGFIDLQPGNKTKFVFHLGVGASLFSNRILTTPDNEVIEKLPYKVFVSGNVGIGMRHNFVKNFGIEFMAKSFVSYKRLYQNDFLVDKYLFFENMITLGFYIPIEFNKKKNSTVQN